MELKNKVVLITGASSGIGWACAHAFAKRGARLALAARRMDRLEALEKELPPGVDVLKIACDVKDKKQVSAAVEQTVKKWESVDVLINNAGILWTGDWEKQELESVEDVMATNYLGCVYFMKAVLPHMRRKNSGHIVNVASIAGILGLPHMASYCASKFALVGLTESLRREYYGTGISLTALCPGLVDTPMGAKAVKNGKRLRMAKTPEGVAHKIVDAVERQVPEVVYGETPGFLLRLSHFFPKTTDWAVHKAVEKMHKG